MSKLAAFGAVDFLPASVIRSQAAEARAERRQDEAEKQERLQRAEQLHDRAVASFLAGAAGRGEDVGALDAARGSIGRTVGDVLAGAAAQLADRIPKSQRGERDYDYELLDAAGPVTRSRRDDDGWPQSGYEADQLTRRAGDLHRDLVAVLARRDYPAAAQAARAKTTRAARSGQLPGPEITRVVTERGNVAWGRP